MAASSKSLIAVFPPSSTGKDEDVQLGMLVDPGDELVPGSQTEAIVSFWADEGRIYATRGTDFRIWYAGRTVGEGRVLETLPDLI